METHRSSDPRDRAIGAALQDAAALAAMVSDELTTSYRGSRRDLYLQTLRAYVVDLGGKLEETPGTELVARFGARRITLRLR